VTVAVPSTSAHAPTEHQRASLVRIGLAAVRSEWLKLRSVRSTIWSMLVALAILVGLGALFCAARVARWDHLDPAERLRFDPTRFSLNGILLAQLAIGVLGVLVMTSEYATGQIRATLGATPQRRIVLAAKVFVFCATTFAVSMVGCLVAFTIGQSILSAKHAQAHLGDPGVLRAVVGGAVYLTLIGAFGVGLGVVLRRTAGAIATLVGFVLILPLLVSFLPSPWNDDIIKYLPGEAGGQLFTVIHEPNMLSWPAGLAVLAAYVIVTLGVGVALLVRRDA